MGTVPGLTDHRVLLPVVTGLCAGEPLPAPFADRALRSWLRMLGVTAPKLRHSARALIVTDDDRILLCRHVISEPAGQFVWAAPGGGVEDGETPLDALRRELAEEVGLTIDADPPHVWHQQVVFDGVPGYDGVVNDYFLVRTEAFVPRGTMSDDELAAENISDLHWWRLADIVAHRGPDLLSPRDLATPLTALVRGGVPDRPVPLGL